ncbi:MAG: putative porin, partial [Bacteroidaceae bacterium]|nr:putative porin [Bacteroidaceae bacterium]
YHECGDKEHGEYRISALFAVNAGKKIGLGFNLDYLYGRGYFQNQNTAHFRSDIYASYIADRYNAHLAYRLHYLKTTENGGLEDDKYITEPESFSTSYETWDMPTNLSKTWNKMNVNSLLFTQRINIGASGTVNDSISSDSLNTDKEVKQVSPLTLSHSMQLDHDDRLFLSNLASNEFDTKYFKDYYFVGDSAADKTTHFAVRNTVALELNEKWKRWLRAGARIYFTHKYERFTLPKSPTTSESYHYNYFNIGAQLMHRKGKLLNYDLVGELRTRDGSRWGEFNILATGDLNLPMWNDSLCISGYAQMSSEEPAFYYRHYQSRNAWWNQEGLSNTLTTRIGAELKYKTAKLTVCFEQVNDGTYFQETLFETPGNAAQNSKLHRVTAIQNGKPVQRLEVGLYNLTTLGIFNWENKLTYQTTSDKSLSPTPAFIAYTNVFLKFKIAKVLNTEIGSDLRFFTRFTPQVYSPIIGQYVLQDARFAEKVGGYPVINAYANMHLKRTRFYIMASHINASDRQKKAFELPHYPMNGFTLHLGISWNFVN